MALTYQQIQDAAKNKGLGQSVVDQFAKKQGVAVPPLIAKASNVDKSAIVSNAGSTTNPATGNNYQAGYAIRKPPMGATPTNPVVDRTPQVSTGVPDYSHLDGLDKNGLRDYIDAITYKQSAGGKVTMEDALAARKAQRMLEDLTSADKTNTDAYAKLIKEQEDAKMAKAQELAGQSNSAVNQYDAYLQSNLDRSVEQANKAAARESQAQQSASSFSGFGRSTFNQDQIGQIQERATQTINSLQQAKDLELQRYKAEQQGADAETLAGFDSQINQYKLAAANAEQSAIQHANEINAKANEDYATKVQNLLASATQSAKKFEDLTPEEKTHIQSLATVLIDDKGNIDPDVLKTIPAGLSAYVINEAAKLKGGLPGQSPDIQQIGKNKYGYFKDGKLVEIGGGSAGGGNGGGYTGTANGDTGTTGNATDLINYNVKFKNIDQSNAFTYATRMIEASQIFNNLEKDIAGLSKAEYIAQKSLGKLPYGSALQSDLIQQQEQAERNFINATLRKESGATISPTEFDNAQKQYLPQPGDSETVLEQKRQNRITALKGISAATGNQGALSKALSAVSKKPAASPTKPTTAPTTGPKEGEVSKSKSGKPIVFKGGQWIYQ